MAKSKKVRKHRQVEITLEPDGFSIHTFELSMQFSKSEWKKCKQKLYAEQEKNGGRWIYPDNQHDGHICTRYTDAGIRIRLEYNDTGSGKDICFVRMIVNPRRLISRKKEYLGIFPPDKNSIELLEKAFYSVLKKSPFPDDIHKYYLTRVDLCTNIRCKNNKVFRELVRLLRKTATPKKYERKFYQSRDRKKANLYNKHYIRISCGSQELVIYDKTYQMEENNLVAAYDSLPDSVLRIEVHYARAKLCRIESTLCDNDPLAVIRFLMQESKPRIIKLVEKCYPQLDYLAYDEAQMKIAQSGFKPETRERMQTLMTQMQRKQTVDAAFAWMEKHGMQTGGLLKKCEELGINPIPLRRGYAASRMQSLPEILRAVGEKPVTVELCYWKWK